MKPNDSFEQWKALRTGHGFNPRTTYNAGWWAALESMALFQGWLEFEHSGERWRLERERKYKGLFTWRLFRDEVGYWGDYDSVTTVQAAFEAIDRANEIGAQLVEACS